MTPLTVRLVKSSTKSLVGEWQPPDGKRIGVVSCNSSQIVVASACNVYYIEIENCVLAEKSHRALEYEVACLDITPLEEGKNKADLVAIGLWTDISVVILSLPKLETMYTEKLFGGKY